MCVVIERKLPRKSLRQICVRICLLVVSSIKSPKHFRTWNSNSPDQQPSSPIDTAKASRCESWCLFISKPVLTAARQGSLAEMANCSQMAGGRGLQYRAAASQPRPRRYPVLQVAASCVRDLGLDPRLLMVSIWSSKTGGKVLFEHFQ